MSEKLNVVHLDGRQIRVLAHPLRARLLGRLRMDGPATATQLAGALGTNTGATSYHLRKLADAGLVAEEAGSGSGRERYWRAAHDMSSWQRGAFAGDPDALAASDWLTSFQASTLGERLTAWQARVADEPPEWRAAAGASDQFMRLDAAQLTALRQELDVVVERYRRAAAEAPAPDARHVVVLVAGVPS
jgi:predicted ArsR family transcriptional regulator